MKENIRLIVRDAGDPSVGIFEQTWDVDTPFPEPKFDGSDDYSYDEMNHFRSLIVKAYKDFAQGRISALYDFEYKKMEDNHEE